MQECSGECRVIETTVLSAVGLEKTELSSKEEEAAVREAIRRVVLPETLRIRSNFNPARLPHRLEGRFQVEYRKERGVNVAIEIPDDIGRVLAGQAGDLSRAVLEAVAAEAYRSGTITPHRCSECSI